MEFTVLRARLRAWVLSLCVCAAPWVAPTAAADDNSVASKLPEPLTLDYALSLADQDHPDLAVAQAGIDAARAGELQVESQTGWNAYLEANARVIDPSPIAPDQSTNDSRIGLVVTKRLYDFGRTSHSLKAADLDVQGHDFLFLSARQQRRLEIMRRYFDVLLAHLQYARDNEDLAVVYVNLDRLRDRRKLGQVSDLDVLQQEAAYERVRRQRAESENRQRSTRDLLAMALNRPGDLPATLTTPKLPQLKRALPDIEALQKQAAASNPSLRALRAQLAAARQRVAAQRAGARPTLRGEAETFAYNREMGSYDRWRAGVVLDVPLLTGGAVDAAVAKEQAEAYRLDALLRKADMEISQDVLETWLSLQSLRIQRQEAQTESDYRDLYLDRSRALYEMEFKADLGDSMVRLSEAQLQTARTDFAIVLAWARLDALTGSLIQRVPSADGGPTAQPH